MKKILLMVTMVAFFAMAIPAMATEVNLINAKNKLIGWDEVKKYENGDLIPLDVPGVQMVYQVHVKHRDSGVVTFLDETTDLTYQVNLTSMGGVFYCGVSSRLTMAGELIENTESGITWSNSADLVAVPVPFGLVSWLRLQAPTGLRLVP